MSSVDNTRAFCAEKRENTRMTRKSLLGWSGFIGFIYIISLFLGKSSVNSELSRKSIFRQNEQTDVGDAALGVPFP